MKTFITVKEYDYFVCESAASHAQGKRISRKAFDELSDLINESPDQEDNDHSTIFWQRGQRLQVLHYLGIIQTSDDTQIEILPKISDSFEYDTLRQIFLRMLREVGEIPCKSGQNADLSTSKFPLLELFVYDFLRNVDQLVKRGIR